MSTQLFWEGTDITSSIISYQRDENICDSTGFITITLPASVTHNFQLYDSIVLYEEGIKKATLRIDIIDKAMPNYTIGIHAANKHKDLGDHFTDALYNIADTPLLKSRYWIEKFLGDAGVPYTITATTDGEYLPEDDVLGRSSTADIIKKLLQYSGWYLIYDSSGVAQVGKLDFDNENYVKSFTDTDIIDLTTELDDSTLRNRVVVWGKGSGLEAAGWVFADVSVHTPWNYDANDKRTALISNSYIRNNVTASRIATYALNEFAKPSYVKKIKLVGHHNLKLGDAVRINSKYYSGVGVITNLSSSLSAGGRTTDITLDKKCPRLVGALTYNGYVYIGTRGAGVWRKPLSGTTWENFSTGLVDLNIKDLHIANGVFSCVSDTGDLAIRYVGDTSWTPFVQTYPSAGGVFTGTTIDRLTNNIYAAYVTGTYTTISGSTTIEDDVRSYLTTIYSPTSYTSIPIIASGISSIYVIDLDNDEKATHMTAITTEPIGGGGETLGTKHFKSYMDSDTSLFSSATNITGSDVMTTQQLETVYTSTRTKQNFDTGGIGYEAPVLAGDYTFGYDASLSGNTPTNIKVLRTNYRTNTVDTIETDRSGYFSIVAVDETHCLLVFGGDVNLYVTECDFGTMTYSTRGVDISGISAISVWGDLLGTTKYNDVLRLVFQIEYQVSSGVYAVAYLTFENSTVGFYNSYAYLPTENIGEGYYQIWCLYTDIGNGILVTAVDQEGMHGLDDANRIGTNYFVVYNTITNTIIHTDIPTTTDYYYNLDFTTELIANRGDLCAYMAVTRKYHLVPFGSRIEKTIIYKIDYNGTATIQCEPTEDNWIYSYALIGSKNYFYYVYEYPSVPTHTMVVLDIESNTILEQGDAANYTSTSYSKIGDDNERAIYYYKYSTGEVFKKKFDNSDTVIDTLPINSGTSKTYFFTLAGECLFLKLGDMATNPDSFSEYIAYITDLVVTDPVATSSSLGPLPILKYENGIFSHEWSHTRSNDRIATEKPYPAVVYGGDEETPWDGVMQVNYVGDNYELQTTYYNDIYGVPTGGETVHDVKQCGLFDPDYGDFQNILFVTHTADAGISYIRNIKVSPLADPFLGYGVVEDKVYPFSGVFVYKIETTNYQPYPFLFAWTNDNKFYQRDAYETPDDIQSFVEQSTNLPNSEVTVIRVDDSI